jgi:phospholipase C
MSAPSRRSLLKAAPLAAALHPAIARALDIPARRITGTIMDVQHIVILTQENRAFDHYFGTLSGVRGFGDRFPIPLPDTATRKNATVWVQPDARADVTAPVLPFHADTQANFKLMRLEGTPHTFADAQAAWDDGRMQAWPPAKHNHAMAYFTRADLPFQFALAEAFTLCDAYHCALHAGTDPNRLFIWTGTNDPAGTGHGPVIYNAYDELTSDEHGHGGYEWITYPERLQAAGINWQIYQNMANNFDDNPLVGFKLYRKADKATDGPLVDVARRSLRTRDLDKLKEDVLADKLPQVSWVVAPDLYSEHPGPSSPAEGADYTARVLDALTANPEVWAKTVLFVNFDESDGFFDHMPAPSVPSILPDGTMAGASTIDIAGEIHGPDKLPFGLGPRVPMMVVSPWSKGGWVNSELFDHTSVIRFLEARFGVIEPNITPWRRAVCGDLTSCFDFARPGAAAFPPLPDVSKADAVVAVQSKLPVPTPPVSAEPLFQEKGTRPSRPLPYELSVDATTGADGGVTLAFVSSGTATAVFQVYDKQALDRPPRRYTVEPGKSLTGAWPKADGYDLWVYGPNGFLRAVSGPTPGLELTLRQDRATGGVTLIAANKGTAARTVTVKAEAYRTGGPWSLTVAAGGKAEQSWSLADSGHWYDLSASDGATAWRFAGRVETGKPGISDPRMGAG